MRLYLTLMILCIGMYLSSGAQTLSGSVIDSTEKAQQGVNVLLFSLKDSVNPKKISLTNGNGNYHFSNVEAGEYFLQFSKTGLITTYINKVVIYNGSHEMETVKMKPQTKDLTGVTVTATRPLLEVKNDRVVLNVEGTISAVGNDAVELLRKSPGVMVDKDDNLSINGKSGVVVYIDGRPLPLSGQDLSAYLRSVQSEQIDAIEIISNPSAKYDAAGNAGIINIKLKKSKSFGTNVSVNAGYGIGIYPKYNAGFSLNTRTKKINYFASLNANRIKNWVALQFDRITADTLFEQKTDLANNTNGLNYKTGADFFINPRSTLGVMVNGTLSEVLLKNDNSTRIFAKPQMIQERLLIADNNSHNDRSNVNANLNYRYQEKSGKTLNFDIDFGRHYYHSDQYQPNLYFTPDGQTELARMIYSMNVVTNIKLFSAKTDYEMKLLKGNLALGSKLTIVDSDNDFNRYDVDGNNYILDFTRSNGFFYNEKITAFYADFRRSYKGFALQTGLRMEHTKTEGDSYAYDQLGIDRNVKTSFSRSYLDFFPTLNLSFTKNPNHQYRINYNRRIDRAVYQDLNPFEFKIDEYTFQRGNPSLIPQYSNKITFSYTYKYKLNLALNYTHVNNVFVQLVDTTEGSKSFISKENLAKQQTIGFTASYPFQRKKYSLITSINAFYSMFEGAFGLNREVDLNVFTVNGYVQQSYKISPLYSVDMSIWASSPSVWQGTFKSSAIGMLDVGASRQVFKNNGTIRIVVTDVFKTLGWKGTNSFAGQNLIASGKFESRQLKLSFTWRFGNSEVRASRDRNSGLEEEQKRVNAEGSGLGQ